eukprot:jgi/Mesvir1/3870/Mv19828-RA.1
MATGAVTAIASPVCGTVSAACLPVSSRQTLAVGQRSSCNAASLGARLPVARPGREGPFRVSASLNSKSEPATTAAAAAAAAVLLLSSPALAAGNPALPEVAEWFGNPPMLEQIAASEDQLNLAIAEGNVDAYAAMFTQDARLLAPSSDPIIGRKDIRNFARGLMDLHVQQVTRLDEVGQLDEKGENAFERSHYVFVEPETGIAVESGKILNLWKKVSGKWQIAVQMFDFDEQVDGSAWQPLDNNTAE